MLIKAQQLSRKTSIKSVKSSSFKHIATDELSSLFEDFRLMCNDAIRVAIAEKPRSRFGHPREAVKGNEAMTAPILLADGRK